MERISLTLLAVVLLFAATGCVGGDPQVSAEDEKNFKNPQKPDFSKIPPDAFKPPKGPAFVGEPSKGSMGDAKTPPPLNH